MSRRSKVIRGSVAIIFLLVLVVVISILAIDSFKTISGIPLNMKLLYALSLVVAIVGYGFLKNKLVKMNIKKSIEYIYRYIYLFLVTLGTRLIAAYIYKKEIINDINLPIGGRGFGGYLVRFLGDIIIDDKYAPLIINTLLAFIIAAIIKRIMFNITMNELLSSIASIIYLFMPLGIASGIIYTAQIFNTVFILLGIYMILKMIDEVKQPKLKNSKYIQLALMATAFGLLDLSFGGTIYIWIFVLGITMLIGDNIDYVQINLSKTFVDKFDIKIKKLIYRLERLKISKLVIGSAIVIVLLLTLAISASIIFETKNIFLLPINTNVSKVIMSIKECFTGSRNYYILTFLVIVILEIIGNVLGRKKDTKSTFLKIAFVVSLIISGLNNGIYNVYVMDTITSILLVLNLGNIYYNREEKIKLLKGSKD